MKRFRNPSAKPGELKVVYGKTPHDNPDLFYCHGGDGAKPCDSRLLSHFFERVAYFEGRNMRQELALRGYDITTLKFSIMKFPTETPSPFKHRI
ncbi:unnamed protein product [marine sediment metagenome]|uniref:Uncharacterized protein n=1 Tax=marine sediment metagenome TaxID=412755 RepID=X0VH99_9ZZZZ